MATQAQILITYPEVVASGGPLPGDTTSGRLWLYDRHDNPVPIEGGVSVVSPSGGTVTMGPGALVHSWTDQPATEEILSSGQTVAGYLTPLLWANVGETVLPLDHLTVDGFDGTYYVWQITVTDEFGNERGSGSGSGQLSASIDYAAEGLTAPTSGAVLSDALSVTTLTTGYVENFLTARINRSPELDAVSSEILAHHEIIFEQLQPGVVKALSDAAAALAVANQAFDEAQNAVHSTASGSIDAVAADLAAEIASTDAEQLLQDEAIAAAQDTADQAAADLIAAIAVVNTKNASQDTAIAAANTAANAAVATANNAEGDAAAAQTAADNVAAALSAETASIAAEQAAQDEAISAAQASADNVAVALAAETASVAAEQVAQDEAIAAASGDAATAASAAAAAQTAADTAQTAATAAQTAATAAKTTADQAAADLAAEIASTDAEQIAQNTAIAAAQSAASSAQTAAQTAQTAATAAQSAASSAQTAANAAKTTADGAVTVNDTQNTQIADMQQQLMAQDSSISVAQQTADSAQQSADDLAASLTTLMPRITAYDATVGRLQIEGIEQGSTGMREILAWNSSGGYTTTSTWASSLPAPLAPRPGLAGWIRIIRVGAFTTIYIRNIYLRTLSSLTTGAFRMDNGWRAVEELEKRVLPGNSGDGAGNIFTYGGSGAAPAGQVHFETPGDVGIITAITSASWLAASWPTSLPGKQITAPYTKPT